MADTVAPPAGTPTQIAHPWRAVLRTFIAAAVAVGIAWAARTLGIDLTEWSEGIVDSITTVVAGVALGAVQWLLTRPWVEAFLREYVGFLATGVHKEPGRHVKH